MKLLSWHRTLYLFVTCIFLYVAFPVQAAAPSLKMEWKLQPRDLLQFSYTRNVQAGKRGGEKTVVEDTPTFLGFFGDDWDDKAKNIRINSVLHTTDIEKSLLLYAFFLPPKAMREGQTWKFEHPWAGLWEINQKNYSIKGKISITALQGEKDNRIASISGTLHLEGVPIGPKVRDARLTWTSTYSEASGMLTALQFEMQSTVAGSSGKVISLLGTLGQMLPFGIPDYLKEESVIIRGEGTCRIEHVSQQLPQNIIDTAIKHSANFLLDIITGEKFLAELSDTDSALASLSIGEGILTLSSFAILKSGDIPVDDTRFLLGIDHLLHKHEFSKPAKVVSKGFSPDYDTYTPGLMLMLGEAFRTQVAALPVNRKTAAMLERDKLFLQKMHKTLQWLFETFDARANQNTPGWGIPDLSNTQYGILGLHAAARAGIFTEKHKRFASMWKQLSELLVSLQTKEKGRKVKVENIFKTTKDGDSYVEVKVVPRGWPYDMTGKDQRSRLSMTCTGIASLAICKGYLQSIKQLKKSDKKKIEFSILMGMAWLQNNMSVWSSGSGLLGTYDIHYRYYMYALERAGVIAGFTNVGNRDWYRDGALALCCQQGSDGSWNYSAVETSFALLFLKRASVGVYSDDE